MGKSSRGVCTGFSVGESSPRNALSGGLEVLMLVAPLEDVPGTVLAGLECN